jgi:hypothetical protein
VRQRAPDVAGHVKTNSSWAGVPSSNVPSTTAVIGCPVTTMPLVKVKAPSPSSGTHAGPKVPPPTVKVPQNCEPGAPPEMTSAKLVKPGSHDPMIRTSGPAG